MFYIEQSLKRLFLPKHSLQLKSLSTNIFIYNYNKDKTASNYIAHSDFCPFRNFTNNKIILE